MSTTPDPPARTAIEEIPALIEVLHQTGRRLEELTAGEVDTVSNRDGQTVVLRRAQESLRLHEAVKRAAILDALPANIALLDVRGVIIAANEAWQRFVGSCALQGPDHAVGVDYLALCDRASCDDAALASTATEGIRAVLAGVAGTFSLEYPCDSPAQQRWFLMTVTPLAEGQPQGAVVMHLDITDRKKAEDKLRESQSLLRLVVEHIPLRLFWKDRDLRYLGCNTLFARDAGFSNPDELTGRTDYDMAWAAQAGLYRKDDTGVLDSGTPRLDVEEPHTTPDGRTIWLRTSKVPLHDKDGRTIGVLGHFQDVTDRKQSAQFLRESERRFTDMLDNVELVSVMLDREARITYCNEYLLRLTGWRREEVAGKNWFDLFLPPEYAAMKGQFFHSLLAGAPEVSHHDNEILTRSGGRRLIHWNNSVLRSGSGEVVGIAGIGEDITDRKASEVRLAYLTRVHSMQSSINALIVRTRDRDELFTEACRVAVDTGGFRMALVGIVDRQSTKTEVVASAGKDESLLAAISVLLDSSAAAPSTMVAHTLAGKVPVVSNDSRCDPRVLLGTRYAKSGIRSMALLPLIVADEAVGILALYAGETDFFHDEEVKLLAELAGDISFALDNLEKRERLDYLAYYDVLTGLANRTLFLERVAQHMRAATADGHGLALFLIDLERFKNVNDSLGRPAGDALLRQVADWFTRNAGDATLVARLGADHFAAVLPEVKHEGDVTRLVEKTMETFLEHPFRLDDAVLRVAVKVGVALYPDDGADADTLFKNAEAALKKAKATGDRYLFYTQAMTDRMAGTLTLENQLRRALDENQFVLHYQPKIDLASSQVTGLEALIRWNDPRTGLVPPGRFIPILEETGLILEVGRWALRQARDDYLRWRAAGLTAVRVAVNVSPLQLRHRDFIADIEKLVGTDAHASAGLELEITESVVMEDVKHSISSLRALRSLGVTVAIDDFGTGFSSLSYLARLPVDTLKIDRSFITDMTASPEGLSLVSTIINLAHSLKLNVVAEGVETEEQARLLRLLGCDEMQGFLFSKPVPAGVCEERFLAQVPTPARDGP
jgi:diguanylate cyclase (GGDEF)-like protein/PAS domain S-box-containing protein